MRTAAAKEYCNLVSKKHAIETELSELPVGYISKKTIKNNTQYYLQRRVGSRVVGTYLRNDDVQRIADGIARRKECAEELDGIHTRMAQLEQAAALIDVNLYRQLILYKLSYGMDALTRRQKSVCASFGSAMNAIEGVPTSTETDSEIEKWKNGDKSFMAVFEDTLRRYGFPVEDKV